MSYFDDPKFWYNLEVCDLNNLCSCSQCALELSLPIMILTALPAIKLWEIDVY